MNAATSRPRPRRRRAPLAVAAVIVPLLVFALTAHVPRAYAEAGCATHCSIWSAGEPSGQSLYNEVFKTVELGLEFHSDVAGRVFAIRYYQDPSVAPQINHTAHLWSASGAMLATVTIPAGSGWLQADLVKPVSITAGANYWVSYYASDDLYDATVNWPYPANNGALHATAAAYHHYADAFTDSPSLNNANYWVDVVFKAADKDGQGQDQ